VRLTFVLDKNRRNRREPHLPASMAALKRRYVSSVVTHLRHSLDKRESRLQRGAPRHGHERVTSFLTSAVDQPASHLGVHSYAMRPCSSVVFLCSHHAVFSGHSSARRPRACGRWSGASERVARAGADWIPAYQGNDEAGNDVGAGLTSGAGVTMRGQACGSLHYLRRGVGQTATYLFLPSPP
jgi:hypothetical protein